MGPAWLAFLFGVSAVAGAVNSVAGGGTLLSFPALVSAGMNPIAANATSTVAIWPGTLGAIWGFRRELGERHHVLGLLLGPSVVGGLAGSLLLLVTPPGVFSRLVPFLVLFATLLFAAQGRLARRRAEALGEHHPHTGPVATAVLQFLTAVYGGYFGAGIGILMLATLGLFGIDDLHRMNAIKNVLGMAINGTAVAIFVVAGAADLPVAAVMAVGAVLGGWAGADVARRIGQQTLRRAVVFVGLLVSVALFVAEWRP